MDVESEIKNLHTKIYCVNERVSDLKDYTTQRISDVKDSNTRTLAIIGLLIGVIQIAIACIFYLFPR